MNESLTGNLLVASSLATDPVYSRGVCLVVHQDESNVIGVMLNRPLKPSPEALLELLNEESGNRLSQYDQAQFDQDQNDGLPVDEDDTSGEFTGTPIGDESPLGLLHFGGPRSGPVVAIHQTSRFAEAETGEGIYVAAQKQHLEELVRDHPAPYRLIVGHLGWEFDELAAELDAGIWHMVPATTDAVFSAAADMWPRLVRRATSSSMARWVGISDLVGAGDLN
jgi:putative transcriptional regulator